MIKTRLREFEKLEYYNSREHLIRLRELEIPIAQSSTPQRLKNLRTNKLKKYREARDAALFCFGMSEYLGTDVFFSPHENQDFDFVALWRENAVVKFCPVQLKEVVNSTLNPNASLQSIIDRLSKYVSSNDVTVAIKISRQCRFDPRTVKIPRSLNIGGLWVFGGIQEDQSQFALWGDFVTNPIIDTGVIFSYPKA